MDFVLLTSSLAPEHVDELELPETEWVKIIFPEHAAEVVAYVRPAMKRLLEAQFMNGSEALQYLVKLTMIDPGFPGLQTYIDQQLPAARALLEEYLTGAGTVASAINLAAPFFLLSPTDRARFASQVQTYLAGRADKIEFDRQMGENKFDGYHIKEPWFSAVICPNAKIKDGHISFQKDRPIAESQSLPARAA